MIQRMVTSAFVAGIAAGLLAALLHFAFVQKYILLGEEYESGTAVHFHGVTAGGHDHGTADGQDAAAHDHAHDHGDAGEASALQRNGMTVLFYALLYAAYALILVAGFGVARQFGKRVTARDGLLWGIAGFVAIQLAPALGLAPELPGTAGPDLTDRQLWWAATAICTATGLAMIGYGRKPIWVGLAVVLLALPHVISAPELDGFTGVAPPEVASAFAARSLGVGLAAWSLMGWIAGWFWARTED
jgi:cobalt transporter subunit CbtA